MFGIFGFAHGLFLNVLLNAKPGAKGNTKPKVSPPVKPTISLKRQKELMVEVCPEIRRILDRELRAGNRIVGEICSYGPCADVTVELEFIFQSQPEALAPSLDFWSFDPKVHSDGDSIHCREHHFAVLGAKPTTEEWKSDSVLVAYKREVRLKSLSQTSP